ncbi:MAG: hypothetical protein NTW05_25115, partial [Pseudonocardiales bacterium]|nr:hypothetical protein [Pseudonocardiales bacterium]
GTGAAADTGIRWAIAAGATHLARTDADCLPAPDWTARIRAAFADLDLVAGRLLPRRDEGLPAWQRGVLVGAVGVAGTFGRFRPGNRVAGALGPYVMSAGCNMAITADLYERAGGFPRTRIQDVHEDRALVNAVRPLTTRYGARRDVVVRGSSRRVRAWGLVRTLGWYADHRYRPEHVDIRDHDIRDHDIRDPGTPTRAHPDPDSRGRPPPPPRVGVLVRTSRGADASRAAAGAGRGTGPGVWERRVQLGAHPVAYPLVRSLARVGPVVRVPRVGVVVSDAALVRRVLLDTDAFTKTGPGSPAALWTPVVGPSVLLNMEGPGHAALRRALGELFTPAAVTALCGEVAAPLCAELARRLAAGEAVDLVPVAQRLAGAVIAGLIGLDAATAAGPAFAAATSVTAMVRLARPELTPRQVARGRAALARITAPAATAYRDGDPGTVPGRMRALGLSEREALGAVAAFALTGTETVVSFLPRLVALRHDAGVLDDPDERFDEELRVTVPSPVMLRRVAAPARIGDVAVAPGERVVLATLNAARAHGPYAPGRAHPPELRSLWFGAGPHFCLGMPLALEQARRVMAAVRGAGPVRVVRRRVAHRVLIPAYRELVVTACPT